MEIQPPRSPISSLKHQTSYRSPSSSPTSSPSFARKVSAFFLKSPLSESKDADNANVSSLENLKIDETQLEDILYCEDLNEIEDFDFVNPLLEEQKESSPPLGETKSDVPSLGARQRSMKKLFSSRDMKAYNPVEINDKMTILEKLIQNKVNRSLLVKQVLLLKSDYAVKLRFCSAVGEYRTTDDKTEKKEKGKKIVNLFVKPGSMFRMNGVPSVLEQLLLQGKYDVLEETKNTIISELVEIDEVWKAVKSIT